MGNIHLIPTDKPSKLCIDNSCNELNYSEIEGLNSKHITNQHIYITSDEEIKDGDWVLNIEENTIFKPSNDEIYDIKNSEAKYYEYCKKIILTTDPDLIKDGVQDIDDEFLEWFVKNPSCEKVEVDSTCKCVTCNSSVKSSCDYAYKCRPRIFYKIIIPKEEAKQETLKEAAKNIYNEFPLRSESLNELAKENFIKGANWQQEQNKNKYSEEEVRNIANWAFGFYRRNDLSDSELEDEFNRVLAEQFKKK
jgi:hypothetical protein